MNEPYSFAEMLKIGHCRDVHIVRLEFHVRIDMSKMDCFKLINL
jgi:hypothetical protein